MQWYVQVENQAYGPYSEEQMQSFVAEGRINEHSLIANAPNASFYTAIGYDAYKLWSGTGQALANTGGAQIQSPSNSYTYQAQPQHQETAQPAGTPVQTYAPQNNETQQSAPTNVFLIMAEIRSEGAMGFLKSLQTFGTAQRIGDTVWLLRSAHGVEQLRNTLSQTLNRQDRLFILDSSANKTAWFNIGADLDGRIRELWSEDED